MAKNVNRPSFSKYIVFIILFSVLFFTTKNIFYLIYTHQSEVYIDEIFHVPQAKRIAEGDLKTWDPKITTFPGLYLISILLIKGAGAFNPTLSYDLYSLRFTNVIGTLFNFLLFYAISLKIHGTKQDGSLWKISLSALNLTIFPVLYFFSFLYYTDVFSTSFVLLMFLSHLHYRFNCAAIAGGLAILQRQTNVIWVLYFFMHTLCDSVLSEAIKQKKIKSVQALEKYPFKQGYTTLIKVIIFTLKDSVFGHRKKGLLLFNLKFIRSIFVKSSIYLLVLLSFVVFILFNGSIVVGDKSAHTASFHVLQLCYFTAFTTVFAWPFFLQTVVKLARNITRTFNLVSQHKWSLTLGIFTLAICIYFNFQAHPYLLADNRHYSFYVWKRFLGHHIIKYLLIPVYLFGFVALSSSVYSFSKIDLLSFWIATSLCLVPHQLLEFRYFLVPYFIFRLKMKNLTGQHLIFEFITYAVINAFTVIMFVKKPFYWTHEPTTVQRFMW